ncbi:MAG: thioesterase family protein [Planctomycetota bacterium]
MPSLEHVTTFRVRYSETDQMGAYYNSRPLEWFEWGRSELMRAAGLPYTEIEARGLRLPLIEAHLEYRGKARYDDELRMTSRVALCGKARVRFDVAIVHAGSGAAVVHGYTIHAVVNQAGKPVRAPQWLLDRFPVGQAF